MFQGRLRFCIYAALVYCVTAFVFARSARYELVSIDDPDYVLDNTHMVDGLTADNIRWAFVTRSYSDNWHPLAWTSLMADVSLARATGMDLSKWDSRQNPVSRVMHTHNIILHSFNAMLLFLLMVIMVRGRLNLIWPLAFALLWSVHPLRTEVVCWVSERKELVSVFWMLLALISYFSRKGGGWSGYLLALGCAALAMMAKPVAVTIPAVIFAWDWVICGKARWGRFLPFAMLSAITCVLTLRAQTRPMAIGAEQSAATRLASILGGPVVYLRQTFWPTDLSMIYPNTIGYDWLLLGLGAALVLAIAALCVCWLAWKTPVLSVLTFGVAWVYVGLVPMLGFVKVASQEHSDRYTYWVGCGLSAVAVLLLGKLQGCVPSWRKKLVELSGTGRDEWEQLRKIALVGLFAAAGVLAFAAQSRASLWKDSLTIYRDAMSKSYHPSIAHVFVSLLLADGDAVANRQEAEYWLRESATRWQSIEAYYELALFLVTKPSEGSNDAFGPEPYLESEGLLKSVLASDAKDEWSKKARKLLEHIEAVRKERKAALEK